MPLISSHRAASTAWCLRTASIAPRLVRSTAMGALGFVGRGIDRWRRSRGIGRSIDSGNRRFSDSSHRNQTSLRYVLPGSGCASIAASRAKLVEPAACVPRVLAITLPTTAGECDADYVSGPARNVSAHSHLNLAESDPRLQTPAGLRIDGEGCSVQTEVCIVSVETVYPSTTLNG